MKAAIMQPYFLPYIGYFQLINAVDKFVVYDDIQYTKKGWINRNRILSNKKIIPITLPLQKDSDFLTIKDRKISSDFDRAKLLRQIKENYNKAVFFQETYTLLEEIVNYNSTNLFDYIFNSILKICGYLDIETPLIISSSLSYDNTLVGQNKVLNICSLLKADIYTNPSGGVDLYSAADFKKENIDLEFLFSGPVVYPQFSEEFVPHLSVLDLFMMNSKEDVKKILNENYTIKH